LSPELAAIVVAAITSTSALLVSLVNRAKLSRLHIDLNSRLDAALEAQRQLGRAEGRAEAPAPRIT